MENEVEEVGREFVCPHCDESSEHRCKIGSRLDVWCFKCRKTTEYYVRGDGVVDFRIKEEQA